ncbi:hypothetical protein ACBI99_01815 [Nonomuraea sp. ATR24]|uniref:hypothetical protein n=1 Tax=Nonomuraea TaxID=83681 RepID=UPI001C5FACB0|nr:hypothetical protein [Nonomuraea ceibae]
MKKKLAITALTALAVTTMLSSAAHAGTPANVWVNGEAIGSEVYAVGVGAEGPVDRVKVNFQVSKGQVITGVRNGTAHCQIATFAATCELMSGSYPQFFEVTVRRYEAGPGPFNLTVNAISSAREWDYADNSTVIRSY